MPVFVFVCLRTTVYKPVMMMMIMQVTTEGGQTTFYVARSIFPTSGYYEAKAESNATHPAVLLVPSTLSADGVVYCSVRADSDVQTRLTVDAYCGG